MTDRLHGSPFARAAATAALALFSSVLSSCGGGAKTPAPGGGGSGTPLGDQVLVLSKDLPEGLDVRVSDGQQGAPAYDRATLAPARKLTDADAQALLRRTRPLARDPADAQAFAFRPGSQPAPRTGDTITGAFPPAPSALLPPPRDAATGPLRVVRFMPEGKVRLAPELSVTFSQPMVAITSHDDAAATVPVKLTPQPPGRWRWIGTRTIVFDPVVRFPQATTYKVEIPAGTKSAAGTALAAATTFTFETPPPAIVASYPPPNAPQRIDAPIFVRFDQKIDPDAVLARIRLTADGAARPVRMLAPAELAQDKQLAALAEAAKRDGHDGRWLAFRAAADLPADAAIEVTLAAGTPSAEGPNPTALDQRLGFRTFPPLKIIRAECGYRGQCPPGTPFTIELNNPVDPARFDPAQLSISPAIPELKITHAGMIIVVHGQTEPRTQYKAVIAGALRDAFGQTLGQDQTQTWRVGDAVPTFYGPAGVVVLDPAAKQPTLDFFSTNYAQLKVRLYKVAPSDFTAYQRYVRDQWNKDRPPVPPGQLVFDQLVKTAVAANKLVETSVQLAPALGAAGLGHALAIVEPHPWRERYDPPRLISWVQSTKLAIDAYVDSDSIVAHATELATGAAAAGVALQLVPGGPTAQSDANGLATLALPPVPGPLAAQLLLARRGADVAFVADPASTWNERGTWVRQERPSRLAWYVVDDRRMYKPGEEVSIKGWLRVVEPGKGGDLAGIAGAVTSVQYQLFDARDNKIAEGTLPVSAAGGFDAKLALPKTPNLGSAHLSLRAVGRILGAYEHSLQIEEFRRPEFEVSAQASQGPFVVGGGGGDVTVTAKYYAGGPLPGAGVAWDIRAERTSFTPPNRDDFTFGEWVPWWRSGGRYDEVDGGDLDGGGAGSRSAWHHSAKTDATGAHTVHLDFRSVKPAVPMSVVASASVTDVNRQAWSASSALLVHPADRYVGLRVARPFVERGTPFVVDVIGVDLDGKAVPGAAIEVAAVRLDWELKQGRYTRKEVDPQRCTVTAAKEPAPCRFATAKGGEYQITATITDAKGRPNQTKMTFWVSGGDAPPAREVALEQVQLIPDRKEYAAGQTAELLVQAPFYPAEALVSWRRSGIVKTERVRIAGPTQVISVPITEAMVPNLIVQVDLVGAAARTDDTGTIDPALPKQPAYASGTIDLPVPPKQRTLAVQVAPGAAKLAPGETTSIAVAVKDAQGRPVEGAELAVIVVDEAILALTGYQFPNPIDTMYARRGADTRDNRLRGYVTLARPVRAALATGAVVSTIVPGGQPPAEAEVAEESQTERDTPRRRSDGRYRGKNVSDAGKDVDRDGILDVMDGPDPSGAIAIRSNFNPLAAFAPAVSTDAAGRATVTVKVPDNLTRYRIVAIATSGEKQLGKGESALTARLPLMVRPSPPRFLNFGDTFELPVVVQNQTDAPMTVRLAAAASNATLTDGAGREVVVPANDRVEVRFPAAAELAGTARLQLVGAARGAAAGASPGAPATPAEYNDAAEVALPVWTPATTEAFATYGVIDGGAIKQPVALPGKVVTQFGGLEVTTASTNLQALTDALLYLVQYPYECAEQRASRVLAIAALRDVLAAFKTKDLPAPAALEASVRTDLERLTQLQNSDGGFAFWERGRPSEPYLTVYVANALGAAKAKGYAVPQPMLDRAKQYLADIEARYPAWYPAAVRHAISAYALYTRKQLGHADIAKGQRLLASAGGVTKVSMETSGWLLALFAGSPAAAAERAAIVRHALNKVSETAGAASFTTSYGDGAYTLLASDHRVDAVMLDALIQERRELDLIPKVVAGLLAHRKRGRWLNTQENTFALLAMDRYFHTYEKATPDFVARVWLGNDYAGDHAFKGRTTDFFAIPIPMKDVAAHDKQDLTIQKDGAGRLYYRIGMTYAPASLQLAPADHGFVVERRYEGADDPKDVVRQPDGTWKIKAGARVRVKLTMVNESRRYHVALVDPLPAGLEPMNPALAVTGPIPQDPTQQQGAGRYAWWDGPWYEHQNLRDERVEAFASLLWEGVHTYDYVARATTPGRYVVPPPKAEEMYMPETFGRGGSDRVVIE